MLERMGGVLTQQETMGLDLKLVFSCFFPPLKNKGMWVTEKLLFLADYRINSVRSRN